MELMISNDIQIQLISAKFNWWTHQFSPDIRHPHGALPWVTSGPSSRSWPNTYSFAAPSLAPCHWQRNVCCDTCHRCLDDPWHSGLKDGDFGPSSVITIDNKLDHVGSCLSLSSWYMVYRYIYICILYIYVLDRFFVLPASCVMSCQNKNGSVWCV